MVNKFVFATQGGILVPATDTVNEAGGTAYSRSPEEALAQAAVTGCLNDTFYVSADNQLTSVLELAQKNDARFIAQTAIYARESGRMKDMPALLAAVLSVKDSNLLVKNFDKIINNGKMLRNFVQIIRSGVVGRKSFGTRIQKLIRKWFSDRTPEKIFHQSIGGTPSFGDILRMIHPKPDSPERSALYAYLLGKTEAKDGSPYSPALLPKVVQDLEALRAGQTVEIPDVNFQFMANMTLNTEQWTSICKNASWQTLRMNLNTFNRHGVFKNIEMVGQVCQRLTNAEEIKKSGVMPYQLMAAYLNVDTEGENALPPGIRMSLAQALEIATQNVPVFPVDTVLAIDVSGSMSGPVTGNRGSVTTKMRCVDVAALIACSILRKNPTVRVFPFDTQLYGNNFIKGSIVESAEALSKFGGGGTECSLPLAYMNQEKIKSDLVIYVSDNESWVDSGSNYKGTATLQQWSRFKTSNPKSKLVCIDLTPNPSTQAKTRADVMNVGGFNDAVFEVIEAWTNGSINEWVERIKQIQI